MADNRRRLGVEGETQAATYLVRRGYRILGRNLRVDGVEIDLIVARGSHVLFVEVKTRRSRRQGGPIQAVDARKQARLVRGARAWLRTHRGRFRTARFDVIACELDPAGRWQIDHLEGAFDAGAGCSR